MAGLRVHVSPRDMRSHRSAQAHSICRIQAERVDQGGTQPGILEERAGLISTAFEYTIITNRSTAILAFIAGKFDMTFPFRGVDPAAKGHQDPGAAGCLRSGAGNASANLIVQSRCAALRQPGDPPGDVVALDRKSFIDILARAKVDIAAPCCQRLRGFWESAELLKSVPGYDPNGDANRSQARQIMQKLGTA